MGTSASINLYSMDDNAVRNTFKRQRNNYLDLVDRISALPDFILGDILSFLPTKDAVATSILSKRWKSAWVMIRNLDFRHYSNEEEQNDMKFIVFVYRVFLLLDARPLNTFRLHWFTRQRILSSHVNSWINTAITRHLQELSLSPFILDGNFEVPSCVFSCVSLRCLLLTSCCISLSTSFVVCLPRLKTLELCEVEFKSDEVFEKLISGCPMLNYLQLFIQPGDFTYMISSTSLRRLFLHCGYAYRLNLKLEVSSLEYLKLGGFIPKIFVLKSLTSLVEADFQISLYGEQHPRADDCDSIVEAVSALDCAKTLTLSADVMSALSHGTVKLSTKFNRLVKLKTDIRYCQWRSLHDFIQHSDNLEVLTIKQLEKARNVNLLDRFKWISPAEVPRCLSTSLKKILFEGYHGTVEDEHEMIGYMLTHGSVLEVMRITCVGKMISSKFKSVQKIGEYPRKSPFCLVKIFGRTSNGKVEVCFTA